MDPRPFPYQDIVTYKGKYTNKDVKYFSGSSSDINFNIIDSNSSQNQQTEYLPYLKRISYKQENTLSSYQTDQGIEKEKLNSIDRPFWNDFEEYLKNNYRKSSVLCRLLYAKRYYYVLIEENATALLILSHTKKLQVMKSLSILSKYLGCYDKWKQIKERYQLKWSNDDSVQVFKNLTNEESNYSSMLKWVKDICMTIPIQYANILIYCTLTGLRPNEAFSSINLIKSDLYNYLDKDKMILEHVKYPEIFIRKTKKAYISIVNESIIQIAKDTRQCNYNSMRCYFKRRKVPFNLNYCRKIFATYLRINGIESEIIDLLQGRIPKSVFAKHYFKPNFDTYNRVRILLNKLYIDISK